MKKFRNPLANILEIHRVVQQHRETELSSARRERDREQAALDRIRQIRAAAETYRPEGPQAAADLLQRERFIQHQTRLDRQQQQVLAQAQGRMNERQNAVIEARRDVRTFELHRDRLRSRWETEALRDEQRRNDDIANAQRIVRGAPSEAAAPDRRRQAGGDGA